ncbi:hypothetical protein M409DRAFT_20016 [Zasmidium cellare ATCC 36951]|uniref:Uncharacterized protein n=1 Tax=Zasmidium cellare ATCC 36951 TaxID=1080233 RepID=A0A6A6CSC4_ZASCE|nr:uncharacterized protein M409DRAFT_20016 [Zasmidium cellare ATCC 36951]KAF2169603.1 hypothetical protein M409DRAFT_20016 [Zasmidium cellare ATCC 36951]
MNNFASSDIATMAETQSRSSSSTTTNGNQQTSSAATENEQTLLQDESLPWTPTTPTSPQIDIPLSKTSASNDSPHSTSPSSPDTLFSILEELHSTSTTPPTLLRPATVRAVFLSLQEARREMKRLVYGRREQPAARKVCVEEIFREEVCVGEGYEYHLGRSWRLRTLWVQEGVVGTDLVVGGGGWGEWE